MKWMRGGSGRLAIALGLGLAAVAIGAIFGSAQIGLAASKVVPASGNPPVVSGTPQQGSTLTTSDGTWTGTAPLTFSYAWRRCDENGGSCSTISGATAKTFELKQVDVGNTLRSVVTATNADGSTSSSSVPTAVVRASAAPPPSNGCPTGTGGIQIADLSLPARLKFDQQSLTPGVVTPAATSLQVRVRVTACSGRPVQGALVYVTAVPYNQYTVPAESTSGADGFATLNMSQLSGFPAARQQQLMVMFLRARKQGEDIEGGVSTRLLVSFPVSLK
jgi:hypothetical protein